MQCHDIVVLDTTVLLSDQENNDLQQCIVPGLFFFDFFSFSFAFSLFQGIWVAGVCMLCLSCPVVRWHGIAWSILSLLQSAMCNLLAINSFVATDFSGLACFVVFSYQVR